MLQSMRCSFTKLKRNVSVVLELKMQGVPGSNSPKLLLQQLAQSPSQQFFEWRLDCMRPNLLQIICWKHQMVLHDFVGTVFYGPDSFREILVQSFGQKKSNRATNLQNCAPSLSLGLKCPASKTSNGIFIGKPALKWLNAKGRDEHWDESCQPVPL